LDSFIPRYVKVLKVFGAYVEEVRVEGHTSSEFGDNNTDLEKYIGNMRLSQDRTRAVTSYALSTLQDDNREWLQRILTANGLSSSKLIRFPSGNEDEVKSRRVEFKVRTSSRATISELQAVIE
jgi:outer membrane protein OmpA-like peptidoglycan-associated protein